MQIDTREAVAALDVAIEDQRRQVDHLDESYETGNLEGLIRALDIVQSKAHGMTTGAEGERAFGVSTSC